MNTKQFSNDVKSIKQYERYKEYMHKVTEQKHYGDYHPHQSPEENRKQFAKAAPSRPKKPEWTKEDQTKEDELWES